MQKVTVVRCCTALDEFAQQNIAAERFGHVQVPTGAEEVVARVVGNASRHRDRCIE